MRDKKFRIWDIETKQFFYWTISETPPTCLTKSYIESNTQQYAGLKDKNKVEIYEGDKVEWQYETHIVIWLSGAFRLREVVPIINADKDTNIPSYFKSNDNWYITYDLGILGFEKEVTGNIHENPELLEKNNVWPGGINYDNNMVRACVGVNSPTYTVGG